MKLKLLLKKIWVETKLKSRVVVAAVASVYGGDIVPTGRLYATKISSGGEITHYGLVSTKMVTTAGVGALVDFLTGTLADATVFDNHASGTGTTAEAVGNTALVTEVATRAVGTKVEGASANIYRTVATITYAGTFAITEHGILSASSGGVLLDRSVFSAINVISADSIQFTYELTLPAGS